MVKKAGWGVFGLLVVFWVANGMKIPQWLHPASIRELGVMGAGLYVVILAALGGIGFPPVLFMVPAAAVWGPAWLLPMNIAGGMLASECGFRLSRHYLHDTLSSRIPKNVLKYEHRLESHGFSTVLVLRFLFFLFTPINWMLGISDISTRDFRTGTLIGMLPWTLVYTFTGHGVMALLKGGTPLQQALLGMGLLLAVLLWLRWAVKDEAR